MYHRVRKVRGPSSQSRSQIQRSELQDIEDLCKENVVDQSDVQVHHSSGSTGRPIPAFRRRDIYNVPSEDAYAAALNRKSVLADRIHTGDAP
mmetsp:Transcript_17263/g.26155  ORF Transcript_17263/g.26155 Transcript_17263/m.26155 type:complete len:92 (-) Transcript_17263:625-900(-)